MGVILDLLKKFIPGLGGLSGPVVWILGITFIAGGAATWLREDAINDTNAKWEAKAAQAALAAHNQVAEKQLEIERLEKTLALKEKEADVKAKEEAEALSKQAADFPLSADCLKCRIPNERIWVRGAEGVARESSKPRSISKPGS